MSGFQEYPDRETLMAALAERLAQDLSAKLAVQDSVSLCVPGGSTPGPIFDDLAQRELDWSRVSVFLNDERWLPESHERSNTAMLKRRLMTGPAAAASLVPLYADAPEPEDALHALQQGLAPHLPISICLLGMGADMHTASLFPGADRLAEALSPDAPTLIPMRAPGAPEPRVTLSARVLAGAQTIHVLITGEEKRAAYERAQSLPPIEAPINALLPSAMIHWAP